MVLPRHTRSTARALNQLQKAIRIVGAVCVLCCACMTLCIVLCSTKKLIHSVSATVGESFLSFRWHSAQQYHFVHLCIFHEAQGQLNLVNYNRILWNRHCVFPLCCSTTPRTVVHRSRKKTYCMPSNMFIHLTHAINCAGIIHVYTRHARFWSIGGDSHVMWRWRAIKRAGVASYSFSNPRLHLALQTQQCAD